MPRSLPDRLKIPRCLPEAESRESVTQSLQQLPGNQLLGPEEGLIKKYKIRILLPFQTLSFRGDFFLGFMATVLFASVGWRSLLPNQSKHCVSRLFSFSANRG